VDSRYNSGVKRSLVAKISHGKVIIIRAAALEKRDDFMSLAFIGVLNSWHLRCHFSSFVLSK